MSKSVVAKQLAKKYQFELVEWEATLAQLKEKLGTEDAPLETVSFQQVQDHFRARLEPAKCRGKVLFDGFPFSVAELKSFLAAVGAPTSFIEAYTE